LLDQECSWKNHFYFPLRLPQGYVQFYKNQLSQFENQLNWFLKTGSIGLKSGSTSFCTVHPAFFCSASLPCQNSSAQTVEKPSQSVLGPAQPVLKWFTHQLSQSLNREPLWWKPVQPVSGPAQPVFRHNSPTATSFWELLYIPLALSLFIHFFPIHYFLADLLSNKSIHSTSHTQNRISFN
jgi:hypothetical protein